MGMELEEPKFETIEEYQEYLKERQELLGYCKKISQGIDNLDEKSGERAIWELVQNARDMDEDCRICIELNEDHIVFAHHGKPFEYLSLLALVNQNSSKDNPGADLVGQYGTGFMTTHAFSEIVTINGPYKVMASPTILKGYVELENFKLNRSLKDEKAIEEMRTEMRIVAQMHKKTPLYESLDQRTAFSYKLGPTQLADVSSQLASAIRLMPMVLVINERIKKVEMDDRYAKLHFIIQKDNKSNKVSFREDGSWIKVTNQISTTDLTTGHITTDSIISLQSQNGEDVILLPPYPESCGKVSSIPSLFLWFPLLGTERFGVNFVFHSKRLHPVEKRNNVILPENVPSKIEKGKHNEKVLRQMMEVLHEYYSVQDNNGTLTREMCEVNFKSDKDDEITTKFYADLQDMWKVQVPSWSVIPTSEGRKSMNEDYVRVLHPDFYSKLNNEKRKEYEPILATFAQMVKYNEESPYLLPTENLIAWSEIVNNWNCNRDAEFFITVEDVCKAIKNKSVELYKFLKFLKESGNTDPLDKYELLPNRKGTLRKKGDLCYGEFMTDEVYNLTKVLMGEDANKMIDITYLDICGVSNYTISSLHSAIANTMSIWRRSSLAAAQKIALTEEQITALLIFCSATSQQDFNNQRGRLVSHIPALYGKQFKQVYLEKLEDKEEDFYSVPFNLLVDYTLYNLSLKDIAWVNAQKKWLLNFITEFATSSDKDWVGKLNIYGVIPNQLSCLCLKSDLYRNDGVPTEMADIYKGVFGKDLRECWVDIDYETLFVFQEDKPEEIAKRIEDALEVDMKKDKERSFEKIMRFVILKLESSPEWRKWFGHIEDNKAKFTFAMQSGDAQKSLFSLMDMGDKNLQRLAKLSESVDMEQMLDKMEHQWELECNNKARFSHLYAIGKHIEDVLRNKLGTELIQVYKPEKNENGAIADDIQNGQDIVIRVKINENWQDVFYVEVKSKWDFSEPAHMSMRQVRTASLHPDEYALCCVDLRKHKNEDLATLSEEVIVNCTKVKMDIGKELHPMLKGILDADERSEDEQIKISEYRSNISAKVFESGQDLDMLLGKIEDLIKLRLNL